MYQSFSCVHPCYEAQLSDKHPRIVVKIFMMVRRDLYLTKPRFYAIVIRLNTSSKGFNTFTQKPIYNETDKNFSYLSYLIVAKKLTMYHDYHIASSFKIKH